MNSACLGNVVYNVHITDTVIDALNSADTGTVQLEVTRVNHPSNTKTSIKVSGKSKWYIGSNSGTLHICSE
jgi:hypothetical protein